MIGGYNEDGTAFGTKNRTGSRGRSIQQEPQAISSGQTKAATGALLNQRQALFASMEKAGANGLTEDMRKQARALQVTDEGFNQAAARIKTNFAATQPVKVAATAAAAAPSSGGLVPRPPTLIVPNATPSGKPVGVAGAAPAPARPTAPAPVSKIGGIPAAEALAITKNRVEQSAAGAPVAPVPMLDDNTNVKLKSPETQALDAAEASGTPAVNSTGATTTGETNPAVTPVIPTDTGSIDPKKRRSWQDAPTMA